MMIRWIPPLNEVGVRVPLDGVINRCADVVVWITQTVVYTTGVEMTVEVRIRKDAMTFDGGLWFGRDGHRSSVVPLLVGFEWADGTTSSNLPSPELNAGGLGRFRGTAGAHDASFAFGLDHLPPRGESVLVTAAPFLGLSERKITFDAGIILDAASRVEVLWPDDGRPIPCERGGRDAVPRIPSTGWFADHYEQAPPRPAGGYAAVVTPAEGAPRYPDDWVDGAPTNSTDQSCAICGSVNVVWVHPLDIARTSYRVYGKGHSLPSFWALCEACEQMYRAGNDDAVVAVMEKYWIFQDADEQLRQALTVFRRADKGARRFSS